MLRRLATAAFAAITLAAPVQAVQEAVSPPAVVIAVEDREGNPIEGALVELRGPTRGLVAVEVTAGDGSAVLASVPPGTYELRVSSPAFTDVYRLVEVGSDGLRESITLRPTAIEESVTVTASRGAMQQESKTPATVLALEAVELKTRAVDLLPRMLDEEPGILTQETTPGQGSPILRGQSAQSVLYLVDGIRYNNATYRGGNTQYLAWIPSASVETLEAMLGPAGVGYGSDALGGALNVFTATAPAFSPRGTRWSGSVRLFAESATLAGGADATVGGAGGNLSGYLTGTGARYGDVRGGGGSDSHHVTRRYLGFDDRQIDDAFGSRYVDTGFSHAGVSGKLALRAGATGTLNGFLMSSEQFDVRRYDRLLGGEGRVRADFDPQRLLFGYVRYDRYSADSFFEVTASVNRQTDGRVDQRRPTSAISTERTAVTALGLEGTGSTGLGDHLVTGGLEGYDEHVDSSLFEERGGVSTAQRPRYPDGSRYTSFGAFLMDDWNALGNRLQVSAGLRYSWFRYAQRAADNVIGGVPLVPDATESFDDLTYNLGASVALTRDVSIWSRFARGFRAPSINDLGQLGLTGGGFEVSPRDAVDLGAFVGDSEARTAHSTGLAWSSLKPEVVYSLEGGFRFVRDDVRVELTGFRSAFRDRIVRRTMIVPGDVVGQTVGGEPIVAQDEDGRIYTASAPTPVVSRANIGDVNIWGLEFVAQRALGDSWLATVKASLQRGREVDTGFWADKIAPDNLTARLRWRSRGGRLWLEGIFRGALTQDRLNPGDIEDTRIGAFRDASDITDFFVNQGPRLGLVRDGVLVATGETLDEVIARVLGGSPDGLPLYTETPGWAAFGLRGHWDVTDVHSVLFTIDNITDTNYRMHGSGFDALGFNVSLAWTAVF